MLKMRVGVLALMVVGLVASASGQGRKVSGTVIGGASGQPVSGARVEYEEVGVVQSTRTDEKGYFEFGQGYLGVVTVSASSYGTAYARWPPRQGRILDIYLRPRRKVTGTVIDMATRRPVSRAVVNLMVRSVNNNILADTALAPSGSFSFDDLPAASGRVLYLARADGFAPRFGDFALRDKSTTNVQIGLLLEGVIEGVVVDGSGDPLEGARIAWEYGDIDGGGLLQALIGGQTMTEADGVFRLNGIVPDTSLTLQAVVDDSRSNTVTVSVGPGMIQAGIVLLTVD